MIARNVNGRVLPSAQQLIDFEKDIADCFNRAEIRAPVHLSGGNEEQLIDIFALHVSDADWVFTTWRSHYHCLLRGVSADVLKADIIAGRSITLNYPDYRIVSSAIVAGIIPIALGVALSIKRRGDFGHVHCFVGDMAGRTGAAREATDYATGHDLPFTLIVENNNKSVETPTFEVWGNQHRSARHTRYYHYNLPWPHAGAGKRVEF